jgi:hypothetical protein
MVEDSRRIQVEMQGQAAIMGQMDKAFAKAIVTTKIAHKVLGPFYSTWLKLKGVKTVIYKLLGLENKRQKKSNEIGEGENEALEKKASLLGFIKNSYVLMAGAGLMLMAAIGLLLAKFVGTIDIFGQTIDLAPAFTAAWDYVSASLTNFVSGFMGLWATMSESMMQLYEHLRDTGALDALGAAVAAIYLAITAVFAGIFLVLNELGINWGSIFGLLGDIFSGFVDFLVNSGLLNFFIMIVSTFAIILSAATVMQVGLLVLIADLVGYIAGPMFSIISGTIGFIVDFITLAIGVATLPFTLFFALITGGFDGLKDAAKERFGAIGDTIKSLVGNWVEVFVGGFKLMTAPIQWLMDKIDSIFGIDLAGWINDQLSNIPGVGGALSAIGGALFGNTGGVFSGSEGGYPVIMHGTEAVVPLPDGKSIPVSISGGGAGGGSFTANISVSSTGGDAEKIAKAVSKEVQRAFRTRSRSGGYGRGI